MSAEGVLFFVDYKFYLCLEGLLDGSAQANAEQYFLSFCFRCSTAIDVDLRWSFDDNRFLLIDIYLLFLEGVLGVDVFVLLDGTLACLVSLSADNFIAVFFIFAGLTSSLLVLKSRNGLMFFVDKARLGLSLISQVLESTSYSAISSPCQTISLKAS